MAKDHGPSDSGSPFEPGANCWRVEQAERIALIVDAADYFVALRAVVVAARREVLLVGWDFDFEIEMLPGQGDAEGLAPDGFPNRLGAFLEAVVEAAPDLHVRILMWNGAMLLAPGRVLPTLAVGLAGSERIRLALDSHHPFGACHHHKIAVADGALAFCGGIDATEERWDTSEHLPDDPRRVRKDGSRAGPWHDATTAMTGPAAAALRELAHRRWHRATSEELEPPAEGAAAEGLWPKALPVAARGMRVAIARTEPPYDGAPLVNEIERLYLDMIAAAERTLYVESQYFAAESVCAAIEARLREPGGPEIVIVNPRAALSWLEDEAMHVLRGRMIERLRAADTEDRFRIYHPANETGEPIYVHAKVMIRDERVLRIGSSNLDDRSMGFDTECDVAIDAGGGDLAAAFRARLLSEHLGMDQGAFEALHAERGSLIGAIESANGTDGRRLVPIEVLGESRIGRLLADTRLLDPRYRPGRPSAAGRGMRPRHVAIAASLAALGLAGWLIWRGRR